MTPKFGSLIGSTICIRNWLKNYPKIWKFRLLFEIGQKFRSENVPYFFILEHRVFFLIFRFKKKVQNNYKYFYLINFRPCGAPRVKILRFLTNYLWFSITDCIEHFSWKTKKISKIYSNEFLSTLSKSFVENQKKIQKNKFWKTYILQNATNQLPFFY